MKASFWKFLNGLRSKLEIQFSFVLGYDFTVLYILGFFCVQISFIKYAQPSAKFSQINIELN